MLERYAPFASIVWIAAGVLIDLGSRVEWFRLLRQGKRTSGIPLFSWLLFYLPACQLRHTALHEGFGLLGALTAFHLVVQLLVPAVVVRFFPTA